RIVIVVDNEKPESPKSDDKKEAPEKKKEWKKNWTVPKFELPDIEEMMKNLPSGLDAEQMKQFREQMTKAREQMPQAVEQVRNQVDVKKELDNARVQMRKQLAEIGLEGQPLTVLLDRPGGGRLGVRVAAPSEALADQLDLHKGNGLVVEEVVPGSAADKAGLKAHDVLLEFDGKMVSSDPGAFAKMVHNVKAESSVNVVVLRKGKKQTIKDISLAELKSPEAKSVEVRPFLFRKGSPQILLDRPKGEGRRVIITTNRMNDDFTSHRQEDGLSVTVT